MEQTIAFVLGVSAALLIWGVVVAFKTSAQVKDLCAQFEDLNHHIDDLEREIYKDNEILDRRIDGEINRVDQIYRECIKHTDSRVDRLESKILSVDTDGCEPTKKILKG